MISAGQHTAILIGLAMTSTLASPAWSQEPVDLRLESRAALDQGVADADALSASHRVIDPGLGVPSGFDQVYRVPGRPGWLMRVSGGLYAMFPASVYSQFGAQIPPNTVFSIGAPFATRPGSSISTTTDPMAERLLLDRRIHPGAESLQPPTAADSAMDTVQNIAEDGVYRRARLIALVRAAVELTRERAGGG